MARRKTTRSKGLTLAQLKRTLDDGKIDPVYLVVGAEGFLRRKAIEAIIAAVGADDAAGDMSVERLDGAAVKLAEVLDAARSLPLFLPVADGPARVILVNPFDPGDASAGKLLEEYLASPVDATCLIFEGASVDNRRVGVKLLDAQATRVACDPPGRESDVRRWIESSAEARGFRFDPEAIAYLLEMVGMDLQRLSQEMDKVSLYAGERNTMDARDLEALLGRSREHSVFELTDALADSRREAAVTVLNRLLDDGEEPVRILAMVSWIIRQLIIAQDLAARGCPERELLQKLGGRWDQRKQILGRARRCDADVLEGLLLGCAQADAAVKTQRTAGGRGVLEGLCRRVCAA